MIRWLTLWMLVIFPKFFLAQTSTVETNIQPDSVFPGTSISIAFKVENRNTKDANYSIKITTGNSNIAPLIDGGKITVPASEHSFFIVPLRIATETSKGQYHIQLFAKDSIQDYHFTSTDTVLVAEQRKISLTAISIPDYVKSGENIKASYLLKNEGNTEEELLLESQNSSIPGNNFVRLLPGESKTITVFKTTNPLLQSHEQLVIQLSAHSIHNPEIKTNAYGTINVYATKPANKDIYFRFPIAVSVAYVGMSNLGKYKGGIQAELKGAGSLSPKNKDWLAFRAVSPNPVDLNAFTQYEEYFANYSNKNINIHLGDKSYSSSYLTEFARYGRGAELSAKIKNWTFGGYYNRPRFFKDIKDEYQFFSQFNIAKKASITGGYLYKNAETIDLYSKQKPMYKFAHLPYLKSKVELANNISIGGEWAYSKTNQSTGMAYMLEAQAYHKYVSGNFMFLKAGPQFAGYFNNTNLFNTSLQFRLSKKFSLATNYIQDAKNFLRDTLRLSAPYRKNMQAGITYQYQKNGTIGLYNGFQKYEDRMEPKQFNYEENFTRLSLNQKISFFDINLEGQIANTKNLLTGFNGLGRYLTANVGFTKFNTAVNLYGSATQTSRYQIKDQKQLYYGARIMSQLTQKSNLSLFYQNDYQPEEYYADRNILELLYQQEIGTKHILNLSGRYTLQQGEMGHKDYIFSLRYTFRLNTPIKKTASYTSVSGSIINMGVKNTEGIRLILGNQTAITNIHGNYVFKNIIPGNHILEIDRNTIEIDDIPNIKLPVLLNLNGKENSFSFGLTKAAKIEGEIEYREVETKNNIVLAGHNPVFKKNKSNSIIIEASNGLQSIKKICTLGESFDFTYLQPGEWTVKLYRNGLDKKYKIAEDVFHLLLKPGATNKIKIKIVKQQTEIKFQDEGVKISYNQKN